MKKVANEVGYPIMLKALAGGGGKGMRLVRTEEEVETALRLSQSEAGTSFGNDAVYIEKYIENPHHIEVQIMGDKYGNVVHLYERECSIQRRNQKVIEESPSPFVKEETRKKMLKVAVEAYEKYGALYDIPLAYYIGDCMVYDLATSSYKEDNDLYNWFADIVVKRQHIRGEK